MNTSLPYRGRFAPSPSGPLHFGSLVAALGSFLRTRSKKGKWLLRIEDIDPPREIAGATDAILKALDVYGLHWDGEITYQSNHLQRYENYLQQLTESGNTFYCCCTRTQIKQAGGYYPGSCRDKNLTYNSETSIRFTTQHPLNNFFDERLGKVYFEKEQMEKEFVLKRKDGLFAYQLAVVIDDMEQNISEVVRGVDLLDSTPKQIQLFQSFQATPPKYLHLPLVVNADGSKLSKQNHATAIDVENPVPTLIKALQFLGQKPPQPIQQENIHEILSWAIENWDLSLLPK